MQKRVLLIFLVFCLSNQLLGQYALKSFKAIEKHDLSKALDIVEKGLEKQPKDPANFFALAKVYSLEGLREEMIDSSHHYILIADSSFKMLDKKQIKRYQRKGMDSLGISSLHATIDSLAFNQVKALNTEERYNHYLELYGLSKFKNEATALRNKVAYKTALVQQTPEALSKFFKLYPNAPQANEARAVFENLYYQQFTNSKNKQAYIDYIAERPNTLFTNKAVKNLLDITSSTADTTQLQQFCNAYERYPAAKKGKDYLTYLKLDSKSGPLLSHYQDGRYHFFNFQKKAVEPLHFDEVIMDSCKWVNQPFFRILDAENTVFLNHKGDTIYKGALQNYELIGEQWIKVKEKGTYLNKLIHLSANEDLRFVALDFKYIDEFTFAEKQADGWWLKTFTGHVLLANAVDSLWKENEFFFFHKASKFALATQELLQQDNLATKYSLPFLYSDYEILEDGVLWLASDDFQTLVDPSLNPLIDLIKANISRKGDYYFLQGEEETIIYDLAFNSIWSGQVEKVQHKSKLLAIKQNAKWALQNWIEQPFPSFKYDSIRIFKPWLAYARDSMNQYLIFEDYSIVNFNEKVSFQLLNAYSLTPEKRELVKYVVLTNELGYKKIFNESGEVIWQGESAEIKVITEKLLHIKLEKEQFLVANDGQVFPLENIQAVGNYDNGAISILNKSKFGIYLYSSNTVISAQSDSKMQVFLYDSIFVFQQESKLGLINKETVLLEAVYDNIFKVNDSLAFVQLERNWQLINIAYPDEVVGNYSYVKDIGKEGIPLFEVRESTGFGLINEQGQMIVPAIFNSLEPIYIEESTYWIAERNLAEIDFKVLVYFNEDGEVLFKNGFKTADFDVNNCE